MQSALTIVHVVLAIGLIALILLQHGKGADAGAAFGSGASSTVFGSRGSASFLTRSTAAIATIFFLTSMALAYFSAKVGEPAGLMDDIDLPVLPGAPANLDLPPAQTGDGAATSGDDVPTPAPPIPAVPTPAGPNSAVTGAMNDGPPIDGSDVDADADVPSPQEETIP